MSRTALQAAVATQSQQALPDAAAPTPVSLVLPALPEAAAALSHAGLDSLVSQIIGTRIRSAMSSANFNMNMAAYTASTDSYVLDCAMRCTQWRMNSHDFRRTHPGSSMLAMLQAATEPFVWAGGILDSLAEEGHRLEQRLPSSLLRPNQRS